MSRGFLFALSFVLIFSQGLWAADAEVEELRKRVEELEKRQDGQVVSEEPSHKKVHPVHSVYGLTVSGGITITGHGVSDTKDVDGQNGAAALSADLAIESPIGEKGRAVIVFDFQRGAGIRNLPAFFLSPNGNPTGYNADIESFNEPRVQITQAYYEHSITDSLTIAVGQLDLTGYFDANEYANGERAQFMANVFVNNAAVEWGGSADFYSPGITLAWAATDRVGVSVGAFDGDGDYADTFDNPFLMAEAGLKLSPGGREGNYRAYYWYRHKRTGSDIANLADPLDTELEKAQNSGIGISVDQPISDLMGVWLRAGVQRERVAQFDRFLGAGANISAPCGRPNDHLGFGYGAAFMGGTYKEYLRNNTSADPGTEHYFELYYNYALSHAAIDEGIHITPDIQYVINPGGDKEAGSLFIYGVRVQAYF
ncbi:MAG TPA: carbohydrate porin [Thermodesulfobacteriota bacterium]